VELPPGADYYGFDISPAMLRRCRIKLAQRNSQPAALVLADMAAAPFVDDAFDVVFHMGGLQFLSDPARGINEMNRVARPGGQVLIVDERTTATRLAARSGARDLRDLAPAGARQVRFDAISDGELFALGFIK
jgi:ubiquinone/menaquinone biosynthesis C-methylase UbiE